jgi:hypothetical protein
VSRNLQKIEAFGWTFAHCTLQAGERHVYQLKADRPNPSWNILYTKGRGTLTDHPDRVPGYTSAGHGTMSTAGEYTLSATEDMEWFCLDARLNGRRKPAKADPLVIAAGSSTNFDQGTRLFIAAGTAIVNGRTFLGPIALLAKSGPFHIDAVTAVYGFDLGDKD